MVKNIKTASNQLEQREYREKIWVLFVLFEIEKSLKASLMIFDSCTFFAMIHWIPQKK